jgi:hypothetical protein
MIRDPRFEIHGPRPKQLLCIPIALNRKTSKSEIRDPSSEIKTAFMYPFFTNFSVDPRAQSLKPKAQSLPFL